VLRNIGLFCICCLLAGMWHTSVAARPLIIAANPQAPFKYEADGQVRGIDIEVMDKILRELAIDYEVLLIESDQRLQVEAKAGRIDVLLLYSQNEERRTFLEYPSQSYIDLDWNFFIRAEDRGKFTFSTFDDLRSMTIGATHGISYTPEFWDAGLQLQLVSENSLADRQAARRQNRCRSDEHHLDIASRPHRRLSKPDRFPSKANEVEGLLQRLLESLDASGYE
jgi:polar amino acid transport system substrate-binding protein